MIWTLLPGAVFLADGCLKKKAEEELKENEQIPVCKGHIVLRKCHNRGVAGGGFADSTKKVEILTFFLLSGLWARLGALDGTYTIGMASRELKDSEVEGGAKATVLAKDGIAVIVSNDNPIDNLTVDQIKGIYTGELTTWADVQ